MSTHDLEPASWKTIVVGTDFSLAADHALATAVGVALAHRAELVLAHVCEMPPGLPPGAILRPEGSAAALSVEAHLRGEAMRQLEEQAARVVRRAVPVALRVEVGAPADKLTRVAATSSADVIVIGTHGRTGLARALVGSTAERVVRLSPIPVLTVRHRLADTLTLPPDH